MPPLSRRAVVKYALVTVASFATAPFSWISAQYLKNGSLGQLFNRLTSNATPTSTHPEIHSICDDLHVKNRCAMFLQNVYYLSPEGRFHQPTIEATRSFQPDQAVQLTLQERLTNNSSFLA